MDTNRCHFCRSEKNVDVIGIGIDCFPLKLKQERKDA
jgi:hypothetical protein